jgi:hypothetical protein
VSEPYKTSERRILALVLAFASAAALTFAAFSQKWLYNPRTVSHEEVRFGPMGNTICVLHGEGEKQCESMSNGKLVDTWTKMLDEARERVKTAKEDDIYAQKFFQELSQTLKATPAFPVFGWIACISCLVAAASLAIAALLVALKKRLVLPIMPTTTALLGLMVALITGCIFVALKPGPAGYVGVNLGFAAFGGGVVVGLAAALLLNKLLRPYDPDLLADSMNPDQF